jgi:N-acetylglucosamine transport system substrate-binding protein
MFKSLGNAYLTQISTGEITPEKAAEDFKNEAATEYDRVKTDLGL